MNDAQQPPPVSSREAADMLAVTQLPRTSIRRALAAGVAGEPVRTRGTLLYDHDKVRALARPPLTLQDLPIPLDRGVFVARLRFGIADDVRFPEGIGEDERQASVSPGWRMGWLTRVTLDLLAAKQAPMPMLATCGGIIVAGATILGARLGTSRDGTVSLLLGPSGEWYDGLHHRALRTPPGRPWTILHGRSTRRAA